MIADASWSRNESQKNKMYNFFLQYMYAYVIDDGEKGQTVHKMHTDA